MADTGETLEIMQQMRKTLVDERRAAVHAGVSPGHEAKIHIDKLIELQLKLETLDRAIEDEQKLAVKPYNLNNLV
jgi:hypothetical protein